ncbi:MAG: PA2779 family protein [Desulfobacteraceae bacterium]|jgi:hypothetical protein|nr:PA2779 family protein [Desulfobacteraceae bacterium]
MTVLQKTLKPMSLSLAVIMFLMVAPVQSVPAAMIDTEAIMDSARGREAREYLHQLMARKDVQAAIVAHGVDADEAWARINSLSDNEVIRIADQIDQLPAGGGLAEFLLIIILVGFIVLVILDLTGVTDVFTFIKSQR